MSRLELEYAGSAAELGECPRWELPEVAVAGRSNSGKSSLLNVIAGRRDLARVSKTPGRTQRIHFFAEPHARLAIVDLPGYGYARVGKAERAQFAAAVERYLQSRASLRGLVLVLDVRRTPQAEERMLVEFAAERSVGVARVATKMDKLGRAERARRLRELDAAGLGPWIPFSATSGEGKEAVIEAILRLSQMENVADR